MPITSTQAGYSSALQRWKKNRLACAGQDAVRDAGTLFLPDDSASDQSPAARSRYERYLLRAVWLKVAGYTKEGLIGMVMRRPPVYEVPSQLEYLEDNADGAGLNIEQFARQCVGENIEVGRLGILVDYPSAEVGLSAEQVRTRNLQARMAIYRAEAVDNWKAEMIGGVMKLTMVKLQETVSRYVDEFAAEDELQYRVLRLRDGKYTQAVYDKNEDVVIEEFVPLANGVPLDHIPFYFVGAETNRPEVDDAVISGVVDLNVAHYQLSADHYKNLHIHSGGLLALTSNMGAEAFADANPNGIILGGGDSGVFLGETGSIQMIQLAPADAIAVKLEAVERQMLSVGANLLTPSVQETAEAARIDASAKASALLTSTDNVSEAIEASLRDCALYMGADPDEVSFKLNREFFPAGMDAQLIMAQIQLMDRGVIAIKDVRDSLRASGLVHPDRSDEDLDGEAMEVEPISLPAPVAAPVVAE